MSKASEYSRRIEQSRKDRDAIQKEVADAKPQDFISKRDGENYRAWVKDDGQMYIERMNLDPDEAIKLAIWILQTFV